MIVKELNLESKDATKKKEEPKKATNTAASLFDNMFSWDNEEKDTSLFGKKKEDKKKNEDKVKSGIEEEFVDVSILLFYVYRSKKNC